MVTINLKGIVDYTMCLILALCILLIPAIYIITDDHPIIKVVSKILVFIDMYVVIYMLHTVICGR